MIVAVQILAIPISSCGVTDKLLWPHTTQLSMHKPMMHNMLIRVITGESQGCSSNGVCKRVEAYCLRSIFSRLVLNTSARKLENASGVHLLCTGVTNEARAQDYWTCS
ncbi:hypothetical protein CMV_014033 [Castanea mollissima]|uniref:Uncharacterized protein n=1 Tax=Castanea mollissima TaxID=60419 RepID=A0A8J4VLD6_9ROSI|nr:hypothetical protein CMV_014033 [Castanea mollissima]